MVRTAGTAIKTTSGGKSTKGRFTSSSSVSASSSGTSRRTIGKGVHQPIPKWQRPILGFIVKERKDEDVLPDTAKFSEQSFDWYDTVELVEEVVTSPTNCIDEEPEPTSPDSTLLREDTVFPVNKSHAADQKDDPDSGSEEVPHSTSNTDDLEKENSANQINIQYNDSPAAGSSVSRVHEVESSQLQKRKLLKPLNDKTTRKICSIDFANLEQFEVENKK